MTIRRKPFSVPLPKDNSGLLTHVNFKGICDDRNDVTIDQFTFADATNMYVDDGNVLTSRPPLKFYDGEQYILQQWIFGDIGLRLRRLEEMCTITCFTHDVENHLQYRTEVEKPNVMMAQVEDKIFIWFDGMALDCFNTTKMLFEDDAVKYLYFPVHKLVINGIESELEGKNFLTDVYRKRHQYSILSDVNFDKLVGRRVSVALRGDDPVNGSHLYDITVQKNQMILIPFADSDNKYFIDIVETPRATVTLRYKNIMEISFDGRSYRKIPSLSEMLGNPQLTKDGMYVVAFTRRGLAKCKIVASETADFIDPERILRWEIEPYLKNALYDGTSKELDVIDPTFIPSGHFETMDMFVYVVRNLAGVPYLYVRYLSGTGEPVWKHEALLTWDGDETDYAPIIDSDDIKVHFRFAASIFEREAAPVVSIIARRTHRYTDYSELITENNVLLHYFFVLAVGSLDNDPLMVYRNPSQVVNTNSSFRIKCRDMGLTVIGPEISPTELTYKFVMAYGLENGQDYLLERTYNAITQNITQHNTLLEGTSDIFVLEDSSTNLITDKYMRTDDVTTYLPKFPVYEDNEYLVSGDKILFNGEYYYIHRCTDDGVWLSSQAINSGDIITLAKDEADYLLPSSRRFKITLPIVTSNGEWSSKTGPIKRGDFIRLYNKGDFTLPPYHPGNPMNTPLYVPEWTYPETDPPGWVFGDPWPNLPAWPTPPPCGIVNGEIKPWKPGDALPKDGVVQFCFNIDIFEQIKPLLIHDSIVWYNIDGTLWTSQLHTDTIIDVDEYINAEVSMSDVGKWFPDNIHFNRAIPEHHAVHDEHYFSYVYENRNLLQVTLNKRDTQRFFSDDGRDFLFYLPKINEQQFSKKITNLHTLSDNEMGVFTQDEIWYIMRIVTDFGYEYTRPIKSKIPAGCREGSDVITALDGKLILFTTHRGVAALAPQDFVASTEQTLTYLSDNIQTLYQSFYTENIVNPVLGIDVKPMIKIATYKYWVLFYKYMSRTILAFDTRGSTWWKWETQYPILSMHSAQRLHLLMQLDKNPVMDMQLHFPLQKDTLLGMNFLWADQEQTLYEDDVIEKTLNGDSVWSTEQNRFILSYAEPQIQWSIMSQKLHFNNVSNYKAVRAMSIIAKGDTIQTARLSTKVYRDFFHPERSEVLEMSINNLLTFVKRFNLMHILNFQYILGTDTQNEMQSQVKIDSISIKYEVKERV